MGQILRDNDAIDALKRHQIARAGDIRNLCNHNKHKMPAEAQVADLIDGTDKVPKTIA